jgi:hypothetical protein
MLPDSLFLECKWSPDSLIAYHGLLKALHFMPCAFQVFALLFT